MSARGAAVRNGVSAWSGVGDSLGRVWNGITKNQVRVCVKLWGGEGLRGEKREFALQGKLLKNKNTSGEDAR